MITSSSNPHETGPEDRERRAETQFFDISPFTWRLSMRSHAWRPPTDLFETETAFIVRMEIAGMREDDFSIEINGRSLTIRGIRQDQSERRSYHQMEIHFGEFSIELDLPNYVDIDHVEAIYSDGFLRVRLPKARPHQVSFGE